MIVDQRIKRRANGKLTQIQNRLGRDLWSNGGDYEFCGLSRRGLKSLSVASYHLSPADQYIPDQLHIFIPTLLGHSPHITLRNLFYSDHISASRILFSFSRLTAHSHICRSRRTALLYVARCQNIK